MCVDSNTLLYELYLFIKLYSKNNKKEIKLARNLRQCLPENYIPSILNNSPAL